MPAADRRMPRHRDDAHSRVNAARGRARSNRSRPPVPGQHQESVLPVIEAGQAVLVEIDFALDDEVRLEPTPGHTPGPRGVKRDNIKNGWHYFSTMKSIERLPSRGGFLATVSNPVAPPGARLASAASKVQRSSSTPLASVKLARSGGTLRV